jgi:hypothetical protein
LLLRQAPPRVLDFAQVNGKLVDAVVTMGALRWGG